MFKRNSEAIRGPIGIVAFRGSFFPGWQRDDELSTTRVQQSWGLVHCNYEATIWYNLSHSKKFIRSSDIFLKSSRQRDWSEVSLTYFLYQGSSIFLLSLGPSELAVPVLLEGREDPAAWIDSGTVSSLKPMPCLSLWSILADTNLKKVRVWCSVGLSYISNPLLSQ